ncbi:hypothetical protein JCM10213_005765 [Rhodosporidiobolus nylandii]
MRSLRHHRRRQDEENDESSSSSGDDEPVAGPALSPVNEHCILVFTLILVAFAAVAVLFWLMKRGHSSSSMASSDSLPSFREDCLSAHNDFRATHNASALTWDDTLADAAKNAYGENLFASASDGYRADQTDAMDAVAGIGAWNSEESMYDYSKPTGFTEETGHFTQTVWKGTSRVGCFFQMCSGIFQSGQYGVYLVCEYAPPGNVVTDDLAFFKENVQAPS